MNHVRFVDADSVHSAACDRPKASMRFLANCIEDIKRLSLAAHPMLPRSEQDLPIGSLCTGSHASQK